MKRAQWLSVLLLALLVVSTGCSGGGGTSVTTGGGGDTTPPVISNPLPTGQQPAGTTFVTMRVTTNESATCRYSTSSTTPYSGMTNFTTTGNTAHSTSISGLTDGQTYNRYVKCSDPNGNVNASGTMVTWSVGTAGTGQATLSWLASVVTSTQGAPDEYRIYHGATTSSYVYYDIVTASLASSFTYTAAGLASGIHCFAVSAYNTGGESSYAACPGANNCCKTIP